MKRLFRKLSIFGLLSTGLIFGWFTQSASKTVVWEEKPLLTWEQNALKVFDKNNYDNVIDLANQQADDPNGNAPLFIYYSHAQKYYLERNRQSAVYFKQHFNIIYNGLRGSNLAVLTRLTTIPQTSWNKKVNKKFIQKAFENAGIDEHLSAILFYLETSDPEIAKSAIKGLQSILQKKRNIVMNGGTLSKTDRAWMADPRLLKVLVKMLGESASPATGFISKLPAFARKKAMGGVAVCLALIQDPALPFLRNAANMGNPSAAAAIQLVQDAKGERLARYSNSTWYSATGQ